MPPLRPFIPALALAALAGVAGARTPTLVAITGGVTPVPGATAATLSVLGAPQIDSRGWTLTTCRIVGPGIRLYQNDIVLLAISPAGQPHVLARTGSPAPGQSGDAAFVSSFFPRLAPDGHAHVIGFLDGSSVAPGANTGIWSGPLDAQLGPHLLAGVSPVAGVPGGVFGGFIATFPGACSRAGMAMIAQLAPGPGGVDANSFVGLWAPASPAGPLELLARLGVANVQGAPSGSPPGLAGAGYALINSRSLVMADNARVAINAGLVEGFGGVAADSDTLILERPPGQPPRIAAREGDPIPGLPGAVFFSLDTSGLFPQSLAGGGGGLSINAAGDMVFVDTDTSSPPPQGPSRLLRRDAQGVFALLASRGDPSPGLPGTLDAIGPPIIDSRGRVAFSGSVLEASGRRTAAVWIVDAGAASARLVAASGRSADAVSPDDAWLDDEGPPRGSIRFSRTGHLVVQWPWRSSPDAAPAPGVWAIDAAGITRVAGAGDAVSVPGLGPRTVSSVNAFTGPAGDDDGRITSVNAAGRVALTLQFTDGSGAIGIFDLPRTGACCDGVACSLTTPELCAGAGRRFAGPGTVCAPPAGAGAPGACCEADFDASGQVDFTDVVVFLDAWFVRAPAADFSGTGAFSVEDVLIFLARWFAGC
jgi:hypothetical protein